MVSQIRGNGWRARHLGVYRAKKDPKCRLCRGSGDNRSGFMMRVNNHICPRCGGYGIVPSHDGNRGSVTAQDMEYIRNNGIVRIKQGRI